MKKYIKKVTIVIFVILIFLLGYFFSKDIEVSKVSLKCNEIWFLLKDKPNVDVYYKITRKIYDEKPYRIYGSYPDTDDKNYSPMLIGISDESPEGREIKFKREQYPPTWYTFVKKENTTLKPITQLSTVIYINRESLKIENRFSGDGNFWSKGRCSIITNEEFDEVWIKEVKNIKEKMKF